MRVLVTGGAGFIGSHIVDALLEAGHEPVVVDDLSTGSRDNVPAGVPLEVIDVRDAARLAEVFARHRPQAVCHQAAQMSVSRSVREPRFDAEVNLVGLLGVLECAIREGVLRLQDVAEGIGFKRIANSLPRAELQRVVEHALSRAREGHHLSEEELLEAVPLRSLMTHVPLDHTWNEVVLGKLARPLGLASAAVEDLQTTGPADAVWLLAGSRTRRRLIDLAATSGPRASAAPSRWRDDGSAAA